MVGIGLSIVVVVVVLMRVHFYFVLWLLRSGSDYFLAIRSTHQQTRKIDEYVSRDQWMSNSTELGALYYRCNAGNNNWIHERWYYRAEAKALSLLLWRLL